MNLGQPGTDPWGLIWPLECFIWMNPQLDIHRIFYLQTDIGRGFCHKKLPESDDDLDQVLDSMYRDVYQELNAVAQRRNQKIHVVGALTDISIDLDQFQNLSLAVPSWCQLLDAATPLVKILDVDSIEQLCHENPKKKSQTLVLLERALARRDFFADNPQWFYPDGIHPNLLAHQLLFEKLTSYV